LLSENIFILIVNNQEIEINLIWKKAGFSQFVLEEE